MNIFRKKIRAFHREFDGLIGNLISPQRSLKRLNHGCSEGFFQTIQVENKYSRKDHFERFRLMPIYENQNLLTCDLKVYQDLYIYNFILKNLPVGAKILEIGGGESRIISELKKDYHFWNLDKLEGEGHGPKKLYTTEGYQLVQANLGNFSDQLPEDFFDLVFSVSVIEHFPESSKALDNILKDLKRVIKDNGFSVHCIDCLIFDDHIWFHPFLVNLQEQIEEINLTEISQEIFHDENLWTLPKYAYYTRWFPKTKKPLSSFGRPFSLNLFWQI